LGEAHGEGGEAGGRGDEEGEAFAEGTRGRGEDGEGEARRKRSDEVGLEVKKHKVKRVIIGIQKKVWG